MNCCKASRLSGIAAVLFAAAMLGVPAAYAAPHRPDRDDAVLERLSPAVVALRQLRGTRVAVATPELSTAVALRVTETDFVTAKVYREWKDGSPDDTGLALGFRHEF